MRALIVALVLLGSTAAHAEPAPKNKAHAVAWSLGGTVISWSLLIASPSLDDGNKGLGVTVGVAGGIGALIAPSFGHWYAGEGFTQGMGARLGGLLTATIGGAFVLQCLTVDYQVEDSDRTCHQSLGIGLAVIGGLVFAYGTAHDIATAPSAVRSHRELAVVPMVNKHSGGLSLAGRF